MGEYSFIKLEGHSLGRDQQSQHDEAWKFVYALLSILDDAVYEPAHSFPKLIPCRVLPEQLILHKCFNFSRYPNLMSAGR